MLLILCVSCDDVSQLAAWCFVCRKGVLRRVRWQVHNLQYVHFFAGRDGGGGGGSYAVLERTAFDGLVMFFFRAPASYSRISVVETNTV